MRRLLRVNRRFERSSAVSRWKVSALLVLLAAAPAWTAPSAEVKGGFDARQHHFAYTIVNRSGSPIVQIEFPHYHADALVAPEGWIVSSTNLVGADVPTEPGVCKATAHAAGSSIQPGKATPFILRLSAAEADVGKGEIIVHFADGKVEPIGGVELPVKRQQGFGSTPALALAGVFILYVIWRAVRGRRAPQAPPAVPPDDVI